MTSEGGTVEDGGTTTATATSTSVPPFLSKTYDMVDDPVTASTVSWSRSSNSFVVWNVPDFSTNLLPKYFKHSNFSSFVRQLNTYGFRKVHPDRFEFANEGFLRGQKHLLHTISRRKPAHGQQQPQQQQQPTEVQKSSTGACVELGKFGLEEEVERLKRDKNVLMQELVRLRQQQHATDHQLHTVGQRVQTMEQRQQQMMSFLAKAMHSPGFFAQLVQQQQNESNRSCISHGNKKRRLPSQEENSRGEVELSSNVPSEGQIVKFQPSMNEAAKAMMRQILKMDTSPRLEPSINGHDSLVISSSIPFSDSNDSGSTSCLTSGVTLSEVFPTSGMPHLPVELGISASCASTTVSELQSSPPIANGSVRAAHFPQDTAQPGFTQGEGTIKENMVEMPDWNFVGSETVDSGSMDMTTDLNGMMPLETIDFPPEPLVDGAPKLPGINDVFWEQFLAVSPLTGDTDEIDSSSLGGDHTNDQEAMVGENNRLDRIHHMDHLTEQMGLLASAGRSG